ncbi:SDR family oxidoreductase [Thalassoroseus pseudoceratinae]|uniref:SDR family oxidoreductase n=1 Tax=Thalassoroseus pseudoceratinae TaxID=2713176 RepID=UPI001423729A|nr:SDR family oxidoreductase [Thalassoroseus pseudoceratinae]
MKDPRTLYPQPPFPQKPQEVPGTDEKMNPPAAHGEESYQGSGKLSGYRTLVTGGDSGIGRATAIAFAKEGADVAIAYLSETKDAETTKSLVEATGRKAVLIPGDLKDEKHCQQVIQKTVDELGGLDVLINNAAYQQTRDSIEEFSSEVFDDIIRTNLYAPFYLCKAALSHLQPGGSIVNTVSIQGYDPSGMLLPYASSKSALIGFTKAAAKLAISKGIRVNAVAPGPVWTPLIPSTMPKEQVENFGQQTLFGRPAQPAELAPLFVWLASPDASYVTGEVYGATGGQTPF